MREDLVEKSAWELTMTDNQALKCRQFKSNKTIYFHEDQLEATGAYGKGQKITTWGIMKDLIKETPKTVGFTYKGWKIKRHEGGVVINKTSKELFFDEKYLDSVDINDFLRTLEDQGHD
jgi:hypothetical protein